MKERNTAGKLGFIKDSEGVYRKGNFIFKDGKIMRESQIVPEGTIKDLKDDYTLIGDVNPRATNVYIDKVGNNYKPSNKLSKNTVAVVMSNRQVMDIKPRDIPEQDDTKELAPEEKPDKPKVIKDFSKPKEFSKLKKESASKKLKLKESEFDMYSDPVEVLEAIYTQYEEMNMTGEFFTDLLNHTDLSLEDLISWYEMGE